MPSRSLLTPGEAIRATPGELSAQGITLVSEDLLTGRTRSPAGAPIHLGFARLTAESLPYWRDYRTSSARVAESLARLARRVERQDGRVDLDELAREHGWSRRELARVAFLMQRRAYDSKGVFQSVKGGATGLEWVLDELYASTEDRFVAYASREPIAYEPPPPDIAIPETPAAQIERHEAIFSPLLLSVGVATDRGVPTVTHFGMFRNPIAFLEENEDYGDLAMPLHGFAATVALLAFSHKHYMITTPMPRMVELLHRSVAPKEIYSGDSDEAVRAYLNERLPAGMPPIPANRRFNFAGFTLGSRLTVVKLEALAQHYRP